MHQWQDNVETETSTVVKRVHHCFGSVAGQGNLDLVVFKPFADVVPSADRLRAHELLADGTLLHHQSLARCARWSVEHAPDQHVQVLERLMVKAAVGFSVALRELGDGLTGLLEVRIEFEGTAIIEENRRHLVRVYILQSKLRL